MLFILAYSTIPPAGYAGDPPARRLCSSCHTGGSGSGWVTVRGLPSFYTQGTTYTLTLVVYDTAASRFGCQMIAKDTAANPVGTFTAVGPNTTVSSGYASHYNAPYAADSFAFVFEYTTPTTYYGPIIIYAVGNGANGDGTSSGDHIYSFVDTLLPATAVSEMERAGGVLLNGRKLTVEAKGEFAIIQLYDGAGRLIPVYTGILMGRRTFHLSTGGILVVKLGKKVKVLKVL